MPSPTDSAIMRHIAEQVMGWKWFGEHGGVLLYRDDHDICRATVAENVDDSDLPTGVWHPLTDARCADELLTALRAKGYGYRITHDENPVAGHSVEVRKGHKVESVLMPDLFRALCLAAYRATGGPDAA